MVKTGGRKRSDSAGSTGCLRSSKFARTGGLPLALARLALVSSINFLRISLPSSVTVKDWLMMVFKNVTSLVVVLSTRPLSKRFCKAAFAQSVSFRKSLLPSSSTISNVSGIDSSD